MGLHSNACQFAHPAYAQSLHIFITWMINGTIWLWAPEAEGTIDTFFPFASCVNMFVRRLDEEQCQEGMWWWGAYVEL